MNLKDYLNKERLTMAEFARSLQLSNSTIWQIVKGRRPGKRVIRAIRDATKGEVTAEELEQGITLTQWNLGRRAREKNSNI